MYLYVHLCMSKRNYRKDKPHPVDFKHYKPIIETITKEREDLTFPQIVRQAVKEWILKYFPEKLCHK